VLGDGEVTGCATSSRNDPASFKVHSNYVALPAMEAFASSTGR